MNKKESRNPADIFLDIARRLGIPLTEEQKKRIQEMRDYCDEEVEEPQEEKKEPIRTRGGTPICCNESMRFDAEVDLYYCERCDRLIPLQEV